jgi:hypothetical protein
MSNTLLNLIKEDKMIWNFDWIRWISFIAKLLNCFFFNKSVK